MGVRQPVVHGCPADLRRKARKQEDVGDERALATGGVGAKRMPGERADPAAGGAGDECDDAEQRDTETERGEDEVLPCRLERARVAAEPDEQRRRGGGRLDEEPRTTEVAHERDSEQDGPERVEDCEVGLLPPAHGAERATGAREIRR